MSTSELTVLLVENTSSVGGGGRGRKGELSHANMLE